MSVKAEKARRKEVKKGGDRSKKRKNRGRK